MHAINMNTRPSIVGHLRIILHNQLVLLWDLLHYLTIPVRVGIMQSMGLKREVI